MQAIQSDQGWIIQHGYYYHLLIRWICLTRFIDGAGIATNLRKLQEKECPKPQKNLNTDIVRLNHISSKIPEWARIVRIFRDAHFCQNTPAAMILFCSFH
jgi:hypothetical protein